MMTFGSGASQLALTRSPIRCTPTLIESIRCSCQARPRLTTPKRPDPPSHRREAKLAADQAARLDGEQSCDADQLLCGRGVRIGEHDRQAIVARFAEPHVD